MKKTKGKSGWYLKKGKKFTWIDTALMKAAPDLLAVCKDILANCGAVSNGRGDKGDTGFKAWRGMLKKVIQKAEGR